MHKNLLKSFGLVVFGAVMASGSWTVWHNADAANKDTYRQLNLFGDVFDRVRADYVEVPDEEKLIDVAITGMLTSLDPHSSYMNAKRFRDMQTQTRGEFGGLGIEVTMENGFVKVVAPIEDTPASRAGLQSNDYITHLDGEPVQGLTLNEAVDKMRGKVKSSITLTVLRPNAQETFDVKIDDKSVDELDGRPLGELTLNQAIGRMRGKIKSPVTITIRALGADKPFDVKLVREIIKIRSVKFNREEDIGYIKLTSFNEKTQIGLEKAIKSLREEIGADKIKGYVIDLRNNPGGLLDQAISVSDTFLTRGEIVSTRGRVASESQRYTADKNELTDGKPVVVLINGGSASASEIVAGALQDHKRAKVIGTRSFGKGSVQTIIPLGGQGAIRLTTARYYTPSGTSIQAKGIRPDYLVEQELPEELRSAASRSQRGEAGLRGHLRNEKEEEGSGSSSYIPPEKENDLQLKAAIDLLNGREVKVKAEVAAPSDTKAN